MAPFQQSSFGLINIICTAPTAWCDCCRQQFCVSGWAWKRPVREIQTYGTRYKHGWPI